MHQEPYLEDNIIRHQCSCRTHTCSQCFESESTPAIVVTVTFTVTVTVTLRDTLHQKIHTLILITAKIKYHILHACI